MGKKGDGRKFCFDLLMTWNPTWGPGTPPPTCLWGRRGRSSGAPCGGQAVAAKGGYAGMKTERGGEERE